MGLNTRFETADDATGTGVDITWTANEPVAAATQTIADGDVPTVADSLLPSGSASQACCSVQGRRNVAGHAFRLGRAQPTTVGRLPTPLRSADCRSRSAGGLR